MHATAQCCRDSSASAGRRAQGAHLLLQQLLGGLDLPELVLRHPQLPADGLQLAVLGVRCQMLRLAAARQLVLQRSDLQPGAFVAGSQLLLHLLARAQLIALALTCPELALRLLARHNGVLRNTRYSSHRARECREGWPERT